MNSNEIPSTPIDEFDGVHQHTAHQSQSFTEFVRSNRSLVGSLFLATSIVFLAGSIFLIWKGTRGAVSKSDTKQTDSKNIEDKPLDKSLEEVDPKSGEFLFGGVGSAFGLLVTAFTGIWFTVAIPNPSIARQRFDIRYTLLLSGLALGVVLILVGLGFAYLWSESITGWLFKDQQKDMKWVVIPLLMIGLGDGLILLAIQPARQEERTNQGIRRLVYGSNFTLAIMLLFEMLVIINIGSGLLVQNRLDTTSSGFYTLSQPTQAILAQIDQQVTAYAIIPSASAKIYDDTRRLLQSCEDTAGSRFKVKYVSPQLDKAELAALRSKYTQLELSDAGVLLTIGDDTSSQVGRYVFIPIEDFQDREGGREQGGAPAFAGEAKLIRELMFLSENKQKPVVYFTQCAGELDPSGTDRRSATMLKAFLEKNYLDVRTHTFDLVAPVVPEDADILIVAAPTKPIPPLVADAIKKYMTETRPGNKQGKLMLLCGCPEPRAGVAITPTGLEGLLSDFNISIGDKYLIGFYDRQILSVNMPVETSAAAIQKKNSVALTLRGLPMTFLLPREVSAVGGNIPGAPMGNPAITTTPILDTISDYVWLEENFPNNIGQTYEQMRRDPKKKQVTQFKYVGVLAADAKSNSGRVAVYGSGIIASDLWARQSGGGSAPIEFDLIGVTVDWLRDRPPAPTGIVSKTNIIYNFPAKVSSGRALYLPLGLSLLAVAGMGVGILVMRRN